jgi:PilZ domain-containing protein
MAAVTKSEPSPESASQKATPVDVERRREARYSCKDPAEARILPGDSSRFPVVVLGVSRSGLQLEVPMPVKKGSQIEISLPRQIVVFGEVRHCRRTGSNFHAGILIKEVCYSGPAVDEHIDDDRLRRYLAHNELTLAEVLRIEDHLSLCVYCLGRSRNRKTAQADDSQAIQP